MRSVKCASLFYSRQMEHEWLFSVCVDFIECMCALATLWVVCMDSTQW